MSTWQFSMGPYDLSPSDKFHRGEVIALPRGTARMVHYPQVGDHVNITWRGYLRYYGKIVRIRGENYYTKILATRSGIKRNGYRRNWIRV